MLPARASVLTLPRPSTTTLSSGRAPVDPASVLTAPVLTAPVDPAPVPIARSSRRRGLAAFAASAVCTAIAIVSGLGVFSIDGSCDDMCA